MLIRRNSSLTEAEVTPRATWFNRRALLLGAGAAGLAGAGLLASRFAGVGQAAPDTPGPAVHTTELSFKPGMPLPDEAATPLDKVASYNNYYEFGTGKSDPAAYAGRLHTSPWAVVVDGECHKPQTVGLEELLAAPNLEERIYRHRCVEAWSMVVPWVGVPLRALLDRVEPTGAAKYVAFQTLMRPNEMPGERSSFIDWPYVEGLRLDEAMHDLTLLAVGLYGRTLPNQNGAPLRLVVPWKYGFKGIKAIVRVSLVREMPRTTWNKLAPKEYGFYANVNPAVDHPRWSQAQERRVGGTTRPTLPFNGYAEQVASLYAGMDLRREF